jgi:hypothetical protein
MLYWSMLPLMLVLFGLGGIYKELHSLQRVDLKKSIIHLQHCIVQIIVIYVFYILLMHTNSYIVKILFKFL